VLEALHAALRPAFAVCLAASQFAADRDTFFTQNAWMLATGVLLTAAGVWLWASASTHLRRATRAGGLAQTGPYAVVRHPVYASIYVLSVGLGLIFFAWTWFLVLAAFLPLWWLECRREERELVARYGQAYETYRESTEVLIPGVW
jgi:protein-S-isoprenylcysteine O-methyltransferase Ste14